MGGRDILFVGWMIANWGYQTMVWIMLVVGLLCGIVASILYTRDRYLLFGGYICLVSSVACVFLVSTKMSFSSWIAFLTLFPITVLLGTFIVGATIKYCITGGLSLKDIMSIVWTVSIIISVCCFSANVPKFILAENSEKIDFIMKCFIDKSELETCTNQIRGLENKPPIFAGMEEWAWIGSYWGVASEHKREAKKHFSDYANILKLKALKLSGKKEAQTLTEQSFWEGLSSFSCHYEDRFCGIHFDQATRELASSGETGLAMVAEYLSGSLVLDEFRDNWPSAGDALPRGIAETVRNNLLRRVAYQEDSSMVEENLDQEELSKYVISRIANRLRLPFYADGVLERVEEMPLDVRHDWSFQIQILFISFSVPYIFAFLFTGFLHFPTVGSRLKKGKNIFARFRYHSKIARKMSLHLAEIETKFYPGFFHGEVEAIQLSGFPADIFLGVRYLRRAKKALQFQALESAERADIEGIFRAVGRLSGRIIPESDETAYEVAAALREKAEKIKDEYLKNQRTHINARRDLIGVMRDLRAVEDVLEARREMLGPTCYELLGVTSEDIEKGGDRAVRDAYRAIIGKIHPDKNGGNICFERLSSLVQGAYERIKTATLREAYYTEISERLSS